MAVVHVSPEIRYRSETGRFLAECDGAAAAAVQAVGERGARMAKRLAPSSSFPEPRGGKLRPGISFYMTGGMVGVIASTARHTLAIERGASAHQIGAPGQLLANKQKDWGPRIGPVNHPGNDAQPFLKPAYAMIRSRMIDVMRDFYPG